MYDILTGAVVMYFLGVVFVLGVTESIDEDNPNAAGKVALTWPFIAVLMIFEMIAEFIHGKQ